MPPSPQSFVPPRPRSGPSRRRVLKTGLIAGAVLSLGAWPRRAAAATATDLLTAPDRAMLRAVARVMLQGSIDDDDAAALDRVVDGVEAALARQPAHVRAELRQLFGLLDLAPARAALCGFWAPWQAASDADVAWFLDWWRDSRFELLRLAYLALQELVVGSYFVQPRSWLRLDYAGPPEIDRPAGFGPPA